MYAANSLLNLVGLWAICWNITVVKIALFSDEDNTPPPYSAPNISCKKEITIENKENNQNLQIKG